MTRAYRFHPEAKAELREAIRWYHENAFEQADRFAKLVQVSIGEIRQRPESWPVIPTAPEYRRRVLSDFPYSLIYEIQEMRILIVCITHQRRDPEYWLSRR